MYRFDPYSRSTNCVSRGIKLVSITSPFRAVEPCGRAEFPNLVCDLHVTVGLFSTPPFSLEVNQCESEFTSTLDAESESAPSSLGETAVAPYRPPYQVNESDWSHTDNAGISFSSSPTTAPACDEGCGYTHVGASPPRSGPTDVPTRHASFCAAIGGSRGVPSSTPPFLVHCGTHNALGRRRTSTSPFAAFIVLSPTDGAAWLCPPNLSRDERRNITHKGIFPHDGLFAALTATCFRVPEKDRELAWITAGGSLDDLQFTGSSHREQVDTKKIPSAPTVELHDVLLLAKIANLLGVQVN